VAFKNSYQLSFLGKPFYYVITGKDAERILAKSSLTEKTFPYEFMEPLLNAGLITNRGDEVFRKRKKMIMSAYRSEYLENYCEISK
jgi:hypothetical protein